jgi:hypothetical protein
MANNATVTLTFKVQADGTLKQVTDNVNKATKATDSLGGAQNRAAKGADNHTRAMNGGVGSANNSARGMSRLLETIGDNNSGLVAAYATLAVNAFAVSAAFNVLRTAAQAEQVMKGLEVQGARTGQALSVTASKVQELSGYTLSLADAMQATAQASAAGFDSKSIERLTKAAADASSALGRNMPDSMDRLVKGLTKMEPELLDELGAMTKLTEASKAYALQTGKSEASLSGLEKRAAFSNAVLAELEVKFGGVAEETSATVKGYDRLAAAFTDLTTSGLNFVSGVLSPLVEFLAKNKIALLAVGVAFLSSIKGQIIPGINELAKAQAESARKQSEASQKDVSNISKLSGGKRKAYNELVQSIKEGSQTEQQYTAASIELADRRTAATNRVYKDQTKGEKLRAAQLAAITDAENKLSFAQSAGAKSKRENAVAAGLSATQDMNMFTAMSSMKQALTQTGVALKANSEVKKASGQSAFNLAGQYNHLKSQAVITGKIMGSAMLNLLPIIGQVIAVIGILIAIYESLKSAQTKALEKALNDLSKVVVNAANTVKELERIESSTASLSTRTEKDLISRSQAITEVANAYKEVAKAATDFKNAEKGEATGTAGLLDSFTSTKSNKSYFLGIREDSKVLTAALKKDAEQNNLFIGAGFDMFKTNQQRLNTESIKTLDVLSNLVPEKLFNDIINLNGGLDEVIGNTEKTNKVAEELTKRFGTTAQATKDLTLSFKNADTALTEFFKSAVQSTPYDNVVKSFEAINTAIIDMTLAVPDSSQWAGLISGIGPELEKMLETQNRSAIEQARASDTVIQGLKNQKALYGELTSEQTKQLETEKGKLNNLNSQLPLIIANISKETERFILAQAQTREMQSQIGLIQAIMAKNQLAYTAGAAGEKARLNREEQIRNLQISSLEIQKSILQSSLDQTQATLLQAEALRGVNKELDIQSSAQKNISAQTELDRQKDEAQKLKIPTKYITTNNVDGKDMFPAVPKGVLNAQQLEQRNAVVYATQNLATAKKELELDRQVISLRSQKRDIQASINSLENQIAALRTQNLTSAQKSAKAAEAEQQSINEINNLLAEKQNQERTSLGLSNKLLRTQQGITSSLSSQIEVIGSDYANQLNSLNSAAQAQEETMVRMLETVRTMKTTASGEELAAYNSLETKLQTQLNLNKDISESKRDALEVQKEISILEALEIGNKSKGLEIQQQSLQYLQRERDLSSELAKTRLNTAQINKEIDLKRQGLYKSEEQQQAFDIQIAKQAYELAVKEAELKKNLIDLEFALLDAQKEVLKQQLIERKTELMSAGYGQDSDIVKQVSAALTNINNAPSGAILADIAKQQVNANIEQLASSLKNIITTGGSADNSVTKMLATIAGIQQRAVARDEAKKALTNTRSDPIAKAVIESGDKQINVTKTGVSRSNELLEKIASNTETTAKVSTESNIKQSDSPGTMAKKVADIIATDSRLKVSEMAGYGNVGGHKKGSMHYESRAFDLNVRGVRNEASNAAAKAILDQKAIEISKTGMEVLWNGMIYQMGKVVGKISSGNDQHTDHLHAEVDSASYKRMKALYANMSSAAAEGATRASQELPAANDNNEIVVTANVPKPLMSGVDLTAGLPPMKEFTQYSDTNWDGIRDKISQVSAVVDSYAEKLRALGPEGEVVAAIAQGSVKFGDAWTTAFEKMDTVGATTADKVGAVASAISASIGVIQSVTAASSNAKVAAIDKEIAAEQKRDGKSAGSVAKLESLEKKKDSIARKQFNTNKKLMMAQAVMSTAAAVAGQLASPPVGPWNIALATMMGAFGLAQVAMIAGTQYESTAGAKTISTPSALSIGKRSDTVDLAKGPNANAGGEAGYLRGAQGTGTNASNYRTTGSAYGGELMRGYGNRGFVVGEKGPEVITPETPITVTPANDVGQAQSINASFNIQALDSNGVQDILVAQKGNIIKMLREASNASGKSFMEDVNVNVYTRPSVGKL